MFRFFDILLNMKYTKADFRPISWNGYGAVLEVLQKKIQAYIKKEGITIDTIVPIMRGGSFAGTYLAYALRLLRIDPIQFKYLRRNSALTLVKLATPHLKKSDQVILVVENNHCFGGTAKAAIKEIKSKAPNATILYAAVFMDASNMTVVGADKIFYGMLSNETGGLSKENMRRKGIKPGFVLFPWENFTEELAAINELEYSYN